MKIISLDSRVLNIGKSDSSYSNNKSFLHISKVQLRIKEYRSSFEIYSNPSEATDNLPDVLYELPKLQIDESDNTKDLRLGSWNIY